MLHSMIAAAVASFAFSAHVTNPWFPLRPGDRYVYAGVKDGKRARDVVTVEHAIRVGQRGRQEYDKGHAEDHFAVVAVWGSNAVLTKEWTPLEPGGLDHKYYVRGDGTILEETVKGGVERNVLVSLTHG
jgi:hypothetical protein